MYSSKKKKKKRKRNKTSPQSKSWAEDPKRHIFKEDLPMPTSALRIVNITNHWGNAYQNPTETSSHNFYMDIVKITTNNKC